MGNIENERTGDKQGMEQNKFFHYRSSPDELGMFGIGETVFVMVTAPRSSLGGDLEIIPTFEKERVIIAIAQEKYEEAIPQDAPDMARGMAVGMLISACVKKAEEYLEKRENDGDQLS